jgi:MFS family permease
VMHARRSAQPLIDLSLLDIPTFSVTVYAGTLYRISAGALPFLLPVMLQVGFGMSAFDSGSITFASAIGAFANKVTIHRVLRRFGYRATCVGTGAMSALSLLACAFFQAWWPAWTMFGVLLIGGFFRSLQFTSLNSLAFADVPQKKLSAGTTLSTMIQQVTNGVGVALGAILLNAALLWRGDTQLVTSDFHAAFVAVALICFTSAVAFLRLEPEAGAEVSGHRREKQAPAE